MSIKIASMNFGDCDTILHNTPNGMKNIAEVLGPNGEVYWSAIKELTGIPPLSIRSNGTILLDYLISGNMYQASGVSPTTPIQPSECGERTGNLFDADRWYGAYKQADGTYQTNRNTWYSLVAKPFTNDDIGKSFCFAADVVPSSGNARFAAVINGVQINGQYIGNRCEVSFTVQTIDDKIIFDYGSGSTTITTVSNIMLNSGSTPLPYEPYGYKIPISSGGVNLFDKDNADIVDLYPDTTTREIKQSSNLSTWSIVLPVEPSTTYTFTMGEATTAIRRRVGMCSDYPTKGAYCTSVDDTPEYDHPTLGNIFTTDADTRYVLIMYVSGAGRDVAIERANRVQVVKGNTALPYEPYNHTTTPVYLGEVQTTRRIKKLMLDGTENWVLEYTDNFLLNTAIDNAQPLQLVVCTHQQSISTGYEPDTNFENVRISQTKKLNFRTLTIPHNLSDFKSYLAQQYANGTPVTVWYVLAEPTTGIVNEPIRKIGNYADTLSMEQAGVQIPTNRGNTVIDVDTELKPSQMYIKYK